MEENLLGKSNNKFCKCKINIIFKILLSIITISIALSSLLTLTYNPGWNNFPKECSIDFRNTILSVIIIHCGLFVPFSFFINIYNIARTKTHILILITSIILAIIQGVLMSQRSKDCIHAKEGELLNRVVISQFVLGCFWIHL